MATELATRVTQPFPSAAREAAQVLEAGGLVAFPTETVYGIGADATNGEAVARIYAAKERPSFNPLIAHVHDLAAARGLGLFNATAETLAAAFWPGPLTLVLPKAPGCPVSALATAGLDTVAVRVPDHPVAQMILAVFGKPVVAPSANRSGRVSPTTAGHVLADLRGRIDLIVNGGSTPVGIESTVVSCLNDQATLLRPGGVAREDIERVLGRPLGFAQHSETADEAPLAPGMLVSHYAPRAQLRLNVHEVNPGEALLAFGPLPLPGAETAVRALNLSPRGELVEAASNLFAHLHELDASGARTIAAMPVPSHGLGEAINDRLRRAAAPRGL